MTETKALALLDASEAGIVHDYAFFLTLRYSVTMEEAHEMVVREVDLKDFLRHWTDPMWW